MKKIVVVMMSILLVPVVHAERVLAGRILNPVTAAQLLAGAGDPAVSADGRYIFFVSTSTNLGPPANGATNLYRADTDAATPAAESIVLAMSALGTGNTIAPSSSGGGTVVAFETLAGNLGGNHGSFADIYVSHQIDLPQNEVGFDTRLVSSGLGGAAPNGASRTPSISADGRYVAFWSDASNLVSNDTNNSPDIFMVSVDGGLIGSVERASVDSSEVPIPGASRFLSNQAWSANSQLLVFSADAEIDGANPGNLEDVFIRDRAAGTTSLISKFSNGAPFTGSSDQASISSNGRYVAFRSFQLGAGISGSRVFVRDRQAQTTFSVPVPPGATVCEEPKVDLSANVLMQCGSAQVGGSQQAWLWQANSASFVRLSRSPANAEGNLVSGSVTSQSDDSSVLVFDSSASNLDPGDTNNSSDVFVDIDSHRLYALFADGFE
ncbi:hypothetical protein C7S18_02215 [Ahniella affigens]|uniref:Calcium-binding protein n=1 Tax=Ahniella affigens TaxID=2021234 RepID=A0A2P1PML1_9GAMM|nr:PD40 domain-containing protein [Ahniella affigens]AVP96078.1 hypothetical protein C7S18_02215 [Ahniella affigens]